MRERHGIAVLMLHLSCWSLTHGNAILHSSDRF